METARPQEVRKNPADKRTVQPERTHASAVSLPTLDERSQERVFHHPSHKPASRCDLCGKI
jgi:hypothetical protein